MRSSFLLIFTLSLVAACGAQTVSTSSPANGNTPTPTSGAVTIVGKYCGSVGGLGYQGDPKVAGQCIQHAYDTCAPATLKFVNAGVDAGTNHYISVQSLNNACKVSDTAQQYSVPPHNTPAPMVYLCAKIITRSDGIAVAQACGAEGDVAISSSRP